MLTRFAPWLSRSVLLAAILVLTLISRKFIADPVGAAEASGISLNSPLGMTNMRASFGAFPLGCAVVALLCLVSPSRRLMGLWFVATIVGVALLVRVFGVIADGTLHASLQVLIAETVLLTLSIAAIAIESARPDHRSPSRTVA
jgi:hypothetical protein